MKKCIVIGGGFAGLSASAYLSDASYKVELIEASPKLGGRAYSFLHKETNTLIDNGQHIMMGCYHDTMSFLSLIGALDKVQVQEKMRVNFLKPNFELHKLKASSLPYPINFLNAILKFTAVTFSERLSILRLFIKLPFLSDRDLTKLSVDEFLVKEKQNENMKKAFWEILCVGALNTSLQKASAKMLVDILKIIFLRGNKGPRLIIPKEGLSDMYCESAKQFIERKGGSIVLSEKVEEIRIENGRAAAICTNKRAIADFDYVICAVPFYALNRIVTLLMGDRHSVPTLSGSESGLATQIKGQMLKQSALGGQHDSSHPPIHPFISRYSSILNVHVWLKKNELGDNFYGLIGSKVHWVFSHTSHLNCVISDADYLMPLSDDEIMSLIYSELEKYFNIKKGDITNFLILKEKRATFIPSKEILNNRPGTETEIKNLFLAGDWVNTGLPSTIESAVKSGRMAADIVKAF
jgi:uncharacterized protein with NAD-binding domain and iron-sulfur cluster